MRFCRSLSLSISLLITLLFISSTRAATIDIINNCANTVWAAAIPGGGRQLDRGQTWTINPPAGTTGARVWARTGCNFDGSGRGGCQTGDCGGVLQCTTYGQSPNTLAEYALNQFNNIDFFDISLVDGFNVPMEFSPTSWGCTRGIGCTVDINEQCPSALRAPGGCNNACTVFKTDEYCCNSTSTCGPANPCTVSKTVENCCTPGRGCGPTNFSVFFKKLCPDAYSYPMDDQTSTFTCPGGTNYQVVFCPSKRSLRKTELLLVCDV